MKLKIILIGSLFVVGSLRASSVVQNSSISKISILSSRAFKIGVITIGSIVVLPLSIAAAVWIVVGTDQLSFKIHRLLFKIRRFRSEVRWLNFFRMGVNVESMECVADGNWERKMFYSDCPRGIVTKSLP
jgi:hypothetical protein